MNQQEPAIVMRLAYEVEIEAPRERVWDAYMHELPKWWTKEFFCFEGTEEMKFEPFVGGRLYEEGPSGSILWATCYTILPGRALDMIGFMTPAFGGPCFTMWHVEFEESEGKTTLKLSDSLVGKVGEGTAENMGQGWSFLFGDLFKNYVEGKR